MIRTLAPYVKQRSAPRKGAASQWEKVPFRISFLLHLHVPKYGHGSSQHSDKILAH